MNKNELVPQDLRDFLSAATPHAWTVAAVADLPRLVNDHANCEKKAAATALSLMFRYADDDLLCERMSRLAREELRHFEQVMRVMRQRGIAHQHLSASRYARRLHEVVRQQEPARKVDTLIIGAFIEARSCERFALLIPVLDEELAKFYRGLLASEARHFRHYLELAERASDAPIAARVAEIGELEGELSVGADDQLRFHSGPPPATDAKPARRAASAPV